MRNILRSFTRQIVAGICQNRLGVVGAVDVRGDNLLCMRDFYQHALQASVRFLEALERHLKPAAALALTSAAASSSSQTAIAAPRCWQRKAAGQHRSARRI